MPVCGMSGGNSVTNQGIIALAKHLPSTKLTELYLRWNNPNCDEGLIALAAALPDTDIEKLSIDNGNIGDDGLHALRKSLEETSIAKFWINGAQCKSHCDIICKRKLRKGMVLGLRLDDCRCTDVVTIDFDVEKLISSPLSSWHMCHFCSVHLCTVILTSILKSSLEHLLQACLKSLRLNLDCPDPPQLVLRQPAAP
eukprot:SAG31_NODE_44_length_31168_cov_16.507290_5_plen_197_part_00